MGRLARAACFSAISILLCAEGVSAEIYRWVDAEGQLHFTQDLSQVPPRHRKAAKEKAAQPLSGVVQTYSRPNSGQSALASKSGRFDRKIRIPFVHEGTLKRIDVVLNDRVTAPFYFDTGASGISLPSHLAQKLGFQIKPDTPRVSVHTAAGVVSRAVVVLDSVEVGRARVEGLEATVNPAMSIGLIGGSFFNNFNYQVNNADAEIVLELNDRVRAGLDEEAWRTRFESVREPLERLDEYLLENPGLKQRERERLERNQAVLVAQLEELEKRANRAEVPQTWRQ
jgi:clan AA aspartic protease (TIGR02281 family)